MAKTLTKKVTIQSKTKDFTPVNQQEVTGDTAEFSSLPKDTYTVTVEGDAYDTFTKEVVVADDVTEKVTLTPHTTEQTFTPVEEGLGSYTLTIQDTERDSEQLQYTNEQGTKMTVKGLPYGTYKLTVTSDHYELNKTQLLDKNYSFELTKKTTG